LLRLIEGDTLPFHDVSIKERERRDIAPANQALRSVAKTFGLTIF
jgi:hypothetical protein